MKTLIITVTLSLFMLPNIIFGQFEEDQLGAWYMYFWNTSLKESPWGFQGDVQYRNWNTIGDLEQLLLRGGVTYQPKNSATKFTMGYGYVQTGAFGDDNSTSNESRIYQEALIPQELVGRFYLKHRFRYEQRFVENQDFRTRYRYNLFLTVPINNKTVEQKTVYLSLYNELFINGERGIGNGSTVQVFDRNRSYAAIGYAIKKQMKLQFGFMRQITNSWRKNQLQLSFHHQF